MAAPERVAALIIQNGDTYPGQHGPKYNPLKEFWANPTAAGRDRIGEAVSEDGFRGEFVGELPEHLVDQVSPDLIREFLGRVHSTESAAR
ncbi:MAG: hypothetical protein LC635_03275 [Pseudonocardiaceae bacterium]|nr:hypothetical protein [Pseudonocardiaceae bacterium]